ncbi:GtrA family protein [Streptomyces sp. NBC_01511]|uniref:GtrA family protein n=1 Tax=Streptomyces sp. NBC_01511 TaxID=2903889 RepID=UPI003870DDBD
MAVAVTVAMTAVRDRVRGRGGRGGRARTTPRRAPKRWSLRTRLVVSAVSLIAVVAAVIGAVTTIAFRSYQYDQLDAQVHAIAERAAGPHKRADRPPGEVLQPRPADVKEPLRTITGGGAPIGTVGLELTGTGPGDVGRGLISAQTSDDDRGQQVTGHALIDSETAALATVPRDGDAHSVTLADLGDYRAEYVSGVNGSFLVGVPLSDVQDTLATLIVVEICVTVAGLVAAGIAVGALPLDRLARPFGDDPRDRAIGGVPGGLARQLVGFCVVGALSTLFYLLLYSLFRTASGAQAANAAALLVSAVANTAANRRLTFGVRGRERAVRHQAQGLVVFGIGLALTSGSLAALDAASGNPAHGTELAVLISANLAATVLRFLLFRAWVFPGRRGVGEQPTTQEAQQAQEAQQTHRTPERSAR